MKSLIRISALALLLLPAIASAQEPQHPLAGTWSVMIQEEGAPEAKELIVEFRIQGEVVTGPFFANGFERYIKQGGTVTANSIQFTTPGMNADDIDHSLVWTGQLTGSGEVAVSVVPEAGDAPARELVLTRRVVQ